MRSHPDRLSNPRRAARLGVLVLAGAAAVAWWTPDLQGRAAQTTGGCRVTGRATAAAIPLPGVAIILRAGGIIRTATSTDTDGTYHLTVPAGSYELTAELTGFGPASRSLSVAEGTPCPPAVNIQLALAPREAATPPPAAPGPAAPGAAPRGAPTGSPAATGSPAGSGAAAPGAAGGRGGAAAQRFATLSVQAQAAGSAPADEEPDAGTRLLLPPGFSTDSPMQALAVNGSMASVDRGMLNDRMDAIGRGEFDPSTGEFGQGFGPGGRGGFGGGPGGGGRGGPGGRGGGGPGGFALGGRGRSQNAYNFQSNYSFGGSALESAPYQLRPGANAQQQPYSRQTFGLTFGGPVRIKGLYKGDRRTNFTATYSGTRGGDLFDQYSTVPGASLRLGDFSGTAATIINPQTGRPFSGNQIPAARLSPSAAALLRFVPLPNLDGSSRNFHYVATNTNTADGVNLRVTHNFTPNAAGGRGMGRGGGFGGPGGARGPGGPGRGNQQGTSVLLNAQVQYRRTASAQNNVFPLLGGQSSGSSLALPSTLNVQHKRTGHSIALNYSRTTARGSNQYAFTDNVAGDAGIGGVSTDPFDWGVPQLSFSVLSSLRDVTPSRRTDQRISLGYGLDPAGLDKAHAPRRRRRRASITPTARPTPTRSGAFVFTGLYSSGGSTAVRSGGIDFADFLLGLPQQATLQYGPGNVRMSGTLAERLPPGRLAPERDADLQPRRPLRAASRRSSSAAATWSTSTSPRDFTAAVPVLAAGTGPFFGAFPARPSSAPTRTTSHRALGFAWRVRPGHDSPRRLRRQLQRRIVLVDRAAARHPAALRHRQHGIGTPLAPLTLADPFAGAATGESPTPTVSIRATRSAWSRPGTPTSRATSGRSGTVSAGYTETRGSSLDIVRAPNRGPIGLRIAGRAAVPVADVRRLVRPACRDRSGPARRPVKGIGCGADLHAGPIARQRVVASAAAARSWRRTTRTSPPSGGSSSFDRRHQLTAEPERRAAVRRRTAAGWRQPGLGQALLRRLALHDELQLAVGHAADRRASPAPSRDVARGTNGTLRANYNGDADRARQSDDRSVLQHRAFTIPAPGTFGTAARNMIIGPGSRQLNAQFSRDVRHGRQPRTLTLQLNATNLLNMVNYAAVDTAVNSPTFGQVLSVRRRCARCASINLRFRF